MAETKPAGIKAKLIAIQNELKAPKNRYNIFGKYNYRSCEDILEAVKPLLKKYGVLLLISDEIEQRGDDERRECAYPHEIVLCGGFRSLFFLFCQDFSHSCYSQNLSLKLD